MQPLTFQGTDFKDVFEIITHCYDRSHKMGIIQRHGVEFLTFLLEKNAKQW